MRLCSQTRITTTVKNKSFLPDYITKKIPLLTTSESRKLDTRRLMKASLITGVTMGFPLIALFSISSDIKEFVEIVSILPLIPFMLLAVSSGPLFICLELLWPFVVVIFTGSVVFVFVYSL